MAAHRGHHFARNKCLLFEVFALLNGVVLLFKAVAPAILCDVDRRGMRIEYLLAELLAGHSPTQRLG